jgi:hypothetical protein
MTIMGRRCMAAASFGGAAAMHRISGAGSQNSAIFSQNPRVRISLILHYGGRSGVLPFRWEVMGGIGGGSVCAMDPTASGKAGKRGPASGLSAEALAKGGFSAAGTPSAAARLPSRQRLGLRQGKQGDTVDAIAPDAAALRSRHVARRMGSRLSPYCGSSWAVLWIAFHRGNRSR